MEMVTLVVIALVLALGVVVRRYGRDSSGDARCMAIIETYQAHGRRSVAALLPRIRQMGQTIVARVGVAIWTAVATWARAAKPG